MKTKRNPSIDLAIDKAGGPVALSRILGCSPQAISKWKRVPAERVLTVAKAARVDPSTIRPDLYPPARKKRAA